MPREFRGLAHLGFHTGGGVGYGGLALKICHGPRATLIRPWSYYDKEVKFKYVIPYRRNSWLQIFDKIISFQNIIYTQDIWNQNKKLHSTKRPRQNLQYIKGITLLEIVDHLKKQKKNPKWIPSKSRFTTQRRQKIPSNSPTMGAKGL